MRLIMNLLFAYCFLCVKQKSKYSDKYTKNTKTKQDIKCVLKISKKENAEGSDEIFIKYYVLYIQT